MTDEPTPAPAGVDVERVRAVARDVWTTLGGKWALAVTEALSAGTLRFTQLQDGLDGVSHKVLTQTLRRLERDGLVHRRVHATVPPRVDYALTEAGRAAHATVNQLCQWSRRYLDDVLTARDRFDQV